MPMFRCKCENVALAVVHAGRSGAREIYNLLAVFTEKRITVGQSIALSLLTLCFVATVR